MSREKNGGRRAGLGLDILAWAGLAAATLAMLWPLGLTNRVLAGLDALTYFTPYWSYRMAELQAGRVPLWNPYLFAGVPFLANPQAAVLYPLHWPLSWLQPEQALIWSALLHAWLAAGFTYLLGRRSLQLTRAASGLAALAFGAGGFALARVENINQLNALAWLPALLWLYDEARRAACWQGRLRWAAGLALVLALQFLAGHTQTAFVNIVGLGLFAAWPPVVAAWNRGRQRLAGRSAGPGSQAGEPRATLRQGLVDLWPLAALAPALLLAAAQLLPTLELNGLGLRTGGLTYREAVSFSLRPRLLVQSLLPPVGGGLAEAFASEGYAEFMGYTAIAALALAGYALWRRRGGPATPFDGRGALLAFTGIFLALGVLNPVYYLLWRFVPGFDLFRAPARWLELYALGVALLAGMGLDALRGGAPPAAGPRRGRRSWGAVAGVVALLALALATQQAPRPLTAVAWAGAAALSGLLLWLGARPATSRAARLGLIALAAAELWLGARALPFAQATAPLGLRNAPAALLARTAAQPAPGRDRFLSLSDIRYDPGDLAELRALQADLLPAAAVERMVRAAKQVEVLAPNLSLLFRLPAVDGYDGGVLPLARYVELQRLFLPPELLLPDGRLAEQLTATPEDRLLDITGVRYVITDKQRDLWFDDVYYDLELSVPLQPAAPYVLDLTAYPAFPVTALGVVAELPSGLPDGATAAEATITGRDGAEATVVLVAEAGARTGKQPAVLSLPEPVWPATITWRMPAGAEEEVILRGLSLIDERTDSHLSVTLSPRGDFRRIHTGDVKIYERLSALGRAWLVHGVRRADGEAAAALLADPAFDPRAEAIIADEVEPRPAGMAEDGEAVAVVAYRAEEVVFRASARQPALLVLADSFYPGWVATIDGRPATVLRANGLFRAVALEPGEHEVVFEYRPASWRIGAGISAAALAALSLALIASWVARRPDRA